LIGDRRASTTPGASFAQINPAVAHELCEHVTQRVLAHAPSTVVDAYAGAGELALTLAHQGVRVTAIELDAEAAAWSESHLPEHSRSIRARVEDVLSSSMPADVVVLNPPRAGVHESVPQTLEDAAPKPRAVVYVSCDPATLARDVARLPSYRIASLVAFDMFPQTSHVETVCELVPAVA
jgi:23S rRNA (uracil1939-C5)-methyltransferase